MKSTVIVMKMTSEVFWHLPAK